MPRISIGQQFDVYAWIDADTDESKGFTTYLGYWDGLSRLVVDEYGTSFEQPIVQAVKQRPTVRKLQAKKYTGDDKELAGVLLNGWAQEAGLYAVDDDDPRLMLQNLWNNVQAYYATSAALRAFLLVYNGGVPKTHAKTLSAAGGLVEGSNVLPFPWNVACSQCDPLTFSGFPVEPTECSNLGLAVDAADIVAKALKTTRSRDLKERVTRHKAEHGLDRAPRGFKKELDDRTRGTTVFDFMWRNRTRSNYGDPSMFYMGSLDQQRASRYINSVRTVTSATMLVFETMVAQRAPGLLLDTAVHFISRDRARISDVVLGGRMRSIGLLKPGDSIDDEPF